MCDQRDVRHGVSEYHDPEIAAAQQVRESPDGTHDRRDQDTASPPLEVHRPEYDRLRENCGNGGAPAAAQKPYLRLIEELRLTVSGRSFEQQANDAMFEALESWAKTWSTVLDLRNRTR